MTTIHMEDLESKLQELQELESLIKEAEEQAESIKDQLKAIMLQEEKEELEVGTHIIRWTTIISNRFDSTRFKKVMPDLYKSFTKPVTSRRFTVSK